MHFVKKFKKALREKNSHLCVGLDSDIKKLPKFISGYEDAVFAFNKLIIEATQDIVPVYKINSAFYESAGSSGWDVLKRTVALFPEEVVTIADAKRGDIENTSEMYAKAFMDELGFDSITIQPYMGSDSVRPFIRRKNKFVFVLALTSNYGSKDFQFLKIGKTPLYSIVIEKALEWNEQKIGFVVGANYTKELAAITKDHPEVPILIPGIGIQKNSLEKTMMSVQHNVFIINQSRSIIYSADKAGNEKEFQDTIRENTIKANNEINGFKSAGSGKKKPNY
ncbi:MAG: orotidine-5'-phosphate decarboxylase [Ignavibacteria bacterium]